MPAKEKAAVNDDRKPRSMKSFAAFICAQPYDLPAKEITGAAQIAGYDVRSITAVDATRDRYKHLRFEMGDPPTWYVREFLASNVSQKAKTFTAGNSRIGPKTKADGPKVRTIQGHKREEVNAIINTVLRAKVPPAGSNATKKPETIVGQISSILDLSPPETIVPPPAPPAHVALAPAKVVEAAPKIEAAPVPVKAEAAATPVVVQNPQFKSDDEEEEDDVQLQELRDSFEVGDLVRVTHPAGNGATFTREGRITRKETKFATVQLGSTHNKIAYKRLALSPRIAGNGSRRANTNSDETAALKPHNVNLLKEGERVKPLKASLAELGASFSQLKSVVVPEAKSELPEPSKLSPPASEPQPTVAAPAVVENPPGVPSDPIALEQGFKDMLVWVEMGKPYFPMIPLYQTRLRSEAAQKADKIERLKQEIERLGAERQEDLRKADDFESVIALIKQLGGEK